MLWCSYFKSFIKSANFSRCGNFVEKLNFVYTPWKIIILLGHSVGNMGHTNPSGWVMIFFMPKCHFLTIWCKNLIAAGVLRKNTWFSVPVPKIKFDSPSTRENCFCVHILSSLLNQQIFPDVENLLKMEFC